MTTVKLILPERYAFKTEIPVLIGDINYGNHLGNDAVLRLCHEARIRFLNSLNYNEADIEGIGIILADAEIRYLSQAFHGENLILTLFLPKEAFRSSGFEMITQVQHQNGNNVALVKNTIIFFDYLTQKIQTIPKLFIKKIEDKCS